MPSVRRALYDDPKKEDKGWGYPVGLVLFYPWWVAAALIKRLLETLYTPFDTKQLADCYIACVKNWKELKKLAWYQPETEPSSPTRNPIGFQIPDYSVPEIPEVGDGGMEE